jgi:hypothetical protein
VSDLEDYHRHLLATVRTRGPRVARKSTIRLLWFYRHQLSHGLPFDLCHLEDWAEPHPDRPGENRTDRIPESVMGPLLAWSLRFVTHFAGDVLAAVSEATPLHAAEHRTAGKHLDTRALQDLLAWHETERRPLPGYRGKVNITFLARKLGCHRASLARLADRISITAAIVGIGDGTNLEARPSAELDGVTWLDKIDYSGKGDDSVGTLARMLQTASYIVIAALSGMRDSEKRAELQQMQHSSCSLNGVSAGRRNVCHGCRNVIDRSTSTACARLAPPQQCCIWCNGGRSEPSG